MKRQVLSFAFAWMVVAVAVFGLLGVLFVALGIEALT